MRVRLGVALRPHTSLRSPCRHRWARRPIRRPYRVYVLVGGLRSLKYWGPAPDCQLPEFLGDNQS